MNIELAVHLGFNCNFRCRHCLNNSAPGVKSWDIDNRDISCIIDEVAKHPEINAISFLGGEPLLYLSSIKRIIEDIRPSHPDRKLIFTITTNGSQITRLYEDLKKISLDQICISYGPEHAQFLKEDAFELAVEAAKSLVPVVKIISTFDESIEVTHVNKVALEKNVEVVFVNLIESGRFKRKENPTTSDLNIVCPNLEDSHNKRLKISYIPKLGFTLCCGPLLFDRLTKSENILSPSISDLLSSTFYKVMLRLRQVKIQTSGSNSCEACSRTLSNPRFLAMFELLNAKSVWNNLKDIKDFTAHELTLANTLFNLRRMGVSSSKSFAEKASSVKTNAFKTECKSEVTDEEVYEYRHFAAQYFYQFPDIYHQAAIDQFVNRGRTSFDRPFHLLKHTADGQLKAALLVMAQDKFPTLDQDVWHIGYWGISGTVTNREDRQAIKEDWRILLQRLSAERPITVIIDQCNTPALRMAESYGMDLSRVRLDPRQD